MSGREKKILLICHSRTGNSKRLASKTAVLLKKRGYKPHIAELRPSFNVTYPGWLILSLFPNVKFPAKPLGVNPGEFGAAIFFLPKWTMSNPVVNNLVSRLKQGFPPTAVVISYGGWRGENFLHAVKAGIWMRGVKVLGGILMKRSEVEAEEERLSAFLDEILPK